MRLPAYVNIFLCVLLFRFNHNHYHHQRLERQHCNDKHIKGKVLHFFGKWSECLSNWKLHEDLEGSGWKKNGFNSLRISMLTWFWCGYVLFYTSLFLNSFQLRFTVLEFVVLMSGESRHATTISPWFHRPGSDKAAEKAEINKPLSLCLSLCLPVYLHFTSKPSWMFLTPVWVFVTAQSPVFPSQKSVFVLDRVCLPAIISSSVWKQSDLPVVPALFQSMTGWLTDLWAY